MNRIKELREKQGFNQSYVCSELGVSTKTLYNYEHSKVCIPDNVLVKLAELYGVSVDYLLGIKNYTTITVADGHGEVMAVIANNEIIERTGYTVVLTED